MLGVSSRKVHFLDVVIASLEPVVASAVGSSTGIWLWISTPGLCSGECSEAEEGAGEEAGAGGFEILVVSSTRY